MSEKLKRFKERNNSLAERIFLAQRYKKEVIEKVQKLVAKLNSGEITRKDYDESLQKIFGVRTPKEWLTYYDNYIETYERQLSESNRQLNKEKLKKAAFVFVPIFLVLFSVIFFVYFSDRAITGLAVQNSKEVFTQNINSEFSSSGSYTFEVKQSGKLNWAKVSGNIEGEGNVKIYLLANGGEILVLDSTDLEVEEVALTGGVITGFNVEGAEDSGGESSDSSSGGSSGSQASTGDVSSTSGGSSEAPSPTSESTSETTSSSDSSESASSPPSENTVETPATTESETPVESNEVSSGTTSEEVIAGNESQNNEETNATGGEPTQENTTVSGQTTTKEKKKKFSDYCKESCDLSNLELDRDSYELRVEINGAVKLNLDKIRYEIEFEKTGEIITEENETVQNETKEITPEIELNETLPELNLTNVSSAPLILKQIPNLEIEVNSSFNLTLSDYFLNAEDYDINKVENITFDLAGDNLEILPDKGFLGNRTAEIIAENSFGKNESNEFTINVVENMPKIGNATSNITTLQYKAVINRPTKWIKILNATGGDLTIELPKEAENITVKTGSDVGLALQEYEDYEGLVDGADKED